jgi:hypothetical protein
MKRFSSIPRNAFLGTKRQSNDSTLRFSARGAQTCARGGVVSRTCVMGEKRCSHGRVKRQCALCTPCHHGRRKSCCAECTPCPHGKVKQNCLVCNSCPHGRVKSKCAECTPCPHGKLKYRCTACNPRPHGKRKGDCAACKTARAAAPSSKRVKREPENSPEVKLEPEIKQEPFTIRGYFGIGE